MGGSSSLYGWVFFTLNPGFASEWLTYWYTKV